MQYRFSYLYVAVAACVFFPIKAHAYIDMGSGSIVFQMLAAGIIGFFFTIKMYWVSLKQKVRSLFFKTREQPKENGSESNDDTHSKY